MFNIDPKERPDINQIIFHLENIAQTKSFKFVDNLTFLKRTEALMHAPPASQPVAGQQANHGAASAAGSAASSSHNSNWMGNATSLFKGSSFLKTIKDASSKVLDTVQR